ncbi:MAG: hypothetical protein PHI88_02930 [Candidatus Pacebacteria bacterium]|nr:hypothetical protein [Candidatus Paceibacterota bacterium]
MKKILTFVLCLFLAVFLVGNFTMAQEQNQQQSQIQTQASTNTPTGSQNQVQTEETNRERTSNQGEEYKLRVTNTIQNLTQTAEKIEENNPEIGENVKEMIQEQTRSVESVSEALNRIQNRNLILRFLIGPDYNEIKKIKGEIEKNRLRIQELNQVMNQLQNEGQEKEIQEQIQLLEQENTNLKELIEETEGRFSLFGWLVRFFQGQ